MKLAVSDLPFAGFRIKELLKLPIEYGVEFFYEFGKNYYWDKILPPIAKKRKMSCSMHGPCAGVNLANAEDTEFFGIFRKTFANCLYGWGLNSGILSSQFLNVLKDKSFMSKCSYLSPSK